MLCAPHRGDEMLFKHFIAFFCYIRKDTADLAAKNKTMKRQKINHAAVWVTIILSQVILFLWHEAFQWFAWEEASPDVAWAQPTIALYIEGFLATVIAMYVLDGIFIRIPVDSARDGIVAGLVIGVVFNVFSIINIYSFSEHPIELALIDFGGNALIFLIGGLILGAWRKYEEVPA